MLEEPPLMVRTQRRELPSCLADFFNVAAGFTVRRSLQGGWSSRGAQTPSVPYGRNDDSRASMLKARLTSANSLRWARLTLGYFKSSDSRV